MNLEDFVSRKNARDQALEAIAAKIRPLPAHIQPSESFIRDMRLRILALDGPSNADKQAA